MLIACYDVHSASQHTRAHVLRHYTICYLVIIDSKFLFFSENHPHITSDLQELVDQMQAIDGAVYEIFTDENNELQGIFFQDERMKAVFDHFPDVLLFDATYKLNDRRMPLGVGMVIDGNGESQVAGFFIMKSENSDILVKLLEKFKKENPSHEKTKIIMCDKSMADKKAFSECLPHAKQQICIYHVKTIFNREITTKKRNISAEKRDKILKILSNMIYSQSESGYMAEYQALSEMNCEGDCFIYSSVQCNYIFSFIYYVKG